ncbi:MAG: FecR family protein [Deltaproteobacteria bacterium]|nr:FecR family protein [Deltaproteobacteria bacterium]
MKTNIIIMFLGMIIGLLLLAQVAVAQDEAPKIIKISGKAEILKNGRWSKAKVGQDLLVGQAIRLVRGKEVTLTSRNGDIEVLFTNNSVVKYNGYVPETSVPWLSSISRPNPTALNKSPLIPEFELVEGETNISVTKGQPLRVITPLIIAAVRGTNFSIQVKPFEGSSKVVVNEGTVMVTGRNGKSALVKAGSTFEYTAEQYADYLRRQKVKIPPEGWKQVPFDAQQALDFRTFKSGVPGRTPQKAGRRPKNNRLKTVS